MAGSDINDHALGPGLPGHDVLARARDGVNDLTWLLHRNDAGSQYTSIAVTDRITDAGIDPSVGTVGDAYDALAESQIGISKSELIWPHRPWRDRSIADVKRPKPWHSRRPTLRFTHGQE